MLRLLPLIFLLPSLAYGATGSGAADTFYVRPTGACANNGDGLSYGCASTGGGDGAWIGFAAVSWSTTTGVDDGDTLTVCGSFDSTDEDTSGYMIFVATSVTGANEAGRITITGDCSADETNPKSWTLRDGTAVTGAFLDGEDSLNYGVGWSTSDYITARNIYFSRYTLGGLISTCNPASDPDAPIYRNLYIDDSDNVGMSFTGVDYTIDGVTVNGADSDGIFICNGVGSAATGTITNTSTIDVARNVSDGDGIQQEAGGGALTATGISATSSSTTKACFIFGSATGAIKVEDWDCAPETGADINGVVVDGSAAGGYVKRGYSTAPQAHVFLRDDVTTFGGAFEVSANIGYGGTRGVYLDGAHSSGVFTIANNTFDGCSDAALELHSTFNPLSADFYNNAMNCVHGLDAASAGSGGSDLTLSNNVYGPDTESWLWYGTTDTALADYQSTSSKDANSTQSALGVVDNSAGKTGFRLTQGSALRRVGKDLNIGNVQDNGNRVFMHPPSIGAWEAADGDIATARTAATTRSARQ